MPTTTPATKTKNVVQDNITETTDIGVIALAYEHEDWEYEVYGDGNVPAAHRY